LWWLRRWIVAATTFLKEPLKEHLGGEPSIDRWLKQTGERPAIQRGMAVPKV
jgi:GST-like protein